MGKARQVEGLEIAGRKLELSYDLAVPPETLPKVSCDWRLPGVAGDGGVKHRERHFDVELVKADLPGRRLQLHLSYTDPDGGKTRQAVIWTGLYDFPLMNFTRISDQERVAMVLTDLDPTSMSATVTLVYYPSSRSGTKDKPYIDDVISRLGQP